MQTHRLSIMLLKVQDVFLRSNSAVPRAEEAWRGPIPGEAGAAGTWKLSGQRPLAVFREGVEGGGRFPIESHLCASAASTRSGMQRL